MQAPGLYIIRYYNIYKAVIIFNDDNNINYENYLHRGPCTPCGKMTLRKTLIKVKITFKGAHNLNRKIS